MEREAESRMGRETEIGATTETWTESGTGMDVGAETETNDESEHEMETESGSESGTEMEVVPLKKPESEDETDPTRMEKREYYSTKYPICKRSDPAKPHNFFMWYHNRASPPDCFSCKEPIIDQHGVYYYCPTCKLEFHKGCYHYPPEIRHPFHLHHPLTITFSHPQTRPDFRHEGYEKSYSRLTEFDDDYDEVNSDSNSDFSVMKCKCCRRNLGDTYYACSICAFTSHLSCAKFSASLTINRPKAHEHTLTLLPRKISSPCDACGLSLCTQIDPVYACLLCNYMLHRRCIYLPRVIKITRHHHRLAKTSSLPPLNFSCGVCRIGVDINCGQFSCTVGCLYSVHSKCATRKDVWDGIELEDVPLEEEEVIPPFTRIDDQTINHFNHEHDLRFHMNDVDYDIRKEIKFCQACVLPIIFDPFYRCMQCNFILHEACANHSLKIHHPLHVHSLNLVLRLPLPFASECKVCDTESPGFIYQCREEKCYFQIDARCASIPEPFYHKSHPHPFYFTLRKGSCMRCNKGKDTRNSLMECLESNCFLCLECAAVPDVAIYKHDKHPLSLCFSEEDTSGTYWCEICEGELDPNLWFYRCQECRLTLHIRCVLGVDLNMKPGLNFKCYHCEVNILPNTGNTRPFCTGCRSRCKGPQIFKFAAYSTTWTYCCFGECWNAIWQLYKFVRRSKDDESDTE